ncbi:MAG TPA: helix-hairpin-helix domain-containing protein [Allocoleopsis sp.]
MPRLRNSYILHQASQQEPEPSTDSTAEMVEDLVQQELPALLNINSATKEEIAALPYLADKSAERILKAIATDGPFRDLKEMLSRANITHLDAEKQTALEAMIRFE